MDFWGAVRVVFRRWYVAFPAFALAIAAAFGVYASIPVVYVSNAVLILTVPPSGGTQPTKASDPNPLTNPLLAFNDGLKFTAVVLVQALDTPEAAAALGVRPDGDTSYAVTNGTSNPELLVRTPFLMVEGKSTSPQAAKDIVVKIVQRAKAELTARQAQLRAPRGTYIVLSEMVPPTTPQVQRASRGRPVAAAALLGAFSGLVASFAVESLAQARARRRVSHEAATAAPERAGEPVLSR